MPARMLRTYLKVPIVAVSVELYDDATNTRHEKPKIWQWIDAGNASRLDQKRILVVDEVDDTRTTLAFVVKEVCQRHNPEAVAVAVLHNKDRPKLANLPESVNYFAGVDIPNIWCVYPWDATDIREHNKKAAFPVVHEG